MFDQIALLDFLEQNGLSYELLHHREVFTAEEASHLKEILPGAHVKNLFLCSKQSLFLVVVLDHDRLDLNGLRKILVVNKLSFAEPSLLEKHLGVKPGSVTPFGLINDKGRLVSLIIDEKVMEFDRLNFHPMRNDQTINIGREDFLKFIDIIGCIPQILVLPKR